MAVASNSHGIMTGITRIKIENLNSSITNAFIVCLLIEKSEPKMFESKFHQGKRAVITFTVRDSERHFINCVIWGTDYFIESCDDLFKYGDVLSILKPFIVQRFSNNAEKFKPLTSSPYELSIRESRGEIIQYDGDRSEYLALLTVPLKPINTALNLSDINLSGTQSIGVLTDLLVVVRAMKPVRQVKTISGESTCREIIVMDRSHSGMSMNLWKKHLVGRSMKWQPLKTALHLINVRIQHSNFHKCIVLGVHSRTLITENPDGSGVRDLLAYAQTISINDNEFGGSSENPNPASITDIMTIQQILDRVNDKISSIDSNQFTAVVYALLTRLDIDSNKQFILRRCTVCQQLINLNVTRCTNDDCLILQYEGNYASSYRDQLDIKTDISDHTGTLRNCHIIGETAECILECSMASLGTLSSEQRESIKYKYFLERCRVKLIVRKRSVLRNSTFVNIVDCTVANHTEVSENIKSF